MRLIIFIHTFIFTIGLHLPPIEVLDEQELSDFTNKYPNTLVHLCQNMKEAHLGARFVRRNFFQKMKLIDISQTPILRKKQTQWSDLLSFSGPPILALPKPKL
jgi:hypothetical protein